MSAIEIKNELDRVERCLFYAQMADFMDWDLYYKLTAERDDLRKQLEKIS